MRLLVALSVALTTLAPTPAVATDDGATDDCPHEYAPIQTVRPDRHSTELDTYVREFLDLFSGTATDGTTVDARSLARRHPVVLLTIFAEWCCNCQFEAPRLARLSRRHHDSGFRVLARSEYSAAGAVGHYRQEFDVPYPVLLGSRNPDPADEDAVRTATTHYRLRTALGSDRKWGTPFNVLIIDGDVGTLYVVDGEFEPGALEELLARHLPAGS